MTRYYKGSRDRARGLGLLAIDDYYDYGDFGGGGGGGYDYGGYSDFLYDPGYYDYGYDASYDPGFGYDIPTGYPGYDPYAPAPPAPPDITTPDVTVPPDYYQLPDLGWPTYGPQEEFGAVPPGQEFTFPMETEPGNPTLPDITTPPSIPYTPPLPDFTFPAPLIDFGPAPSAPMTYGSNLPGYCPTGYYHPINDPYSCVPFPPATTQQQQQAAAAPKPPQQPPPSSQQGCPSGQYQSRRYQRCMPIPNCAQLYPGSVFNPTTEACVAGGGCPVGYWSNPATRRCELIPQCPQVGYTFNTLNGVCGPNPSGASFFDEIPWWLWLGLLAILVLSGGNGDHATTIRHRRAS